MWVRLLKSHTIVNKTHCVGRVLNLLNSYAEELIREKIAVEYNGNFPPDKMKTDFFKPK